jgi:hypothetical protein
MVMQQTSWAVDKICMGSFKINMCFSYGDEDGEILQWCQGTVCVCVFLASSCGWGTVMHEIPISSAQPLTSLPYPRTK